MFCTSCGSKNAETSNFCKQCGSKLEKIAPLPEAEFDRILPEEEQVSRLLERAYRLKTDGKLDEAAELCHEALKLRPDSASAHSVLGELFLLKGDRDRAIREQERVVQLNPGSIADRIKLDEMRGTPGRARATKVVLTDPAQANASRRWIGAGLGVCGVGILAVAGALAYQARVRTQGAPNEGTVAKTSGLNPAPNAAQFAANQTGQPNAIGRNPAPSAPTQEPSNPSVTRATSAPPPQIVYVPQPVPAQPVSSRMTGGGNTKTASLPPINNAATSENDEDKNSGRVLLASDDGVEQTKSGNYVIRMDVGNKKTNGDNSAKPAPGSGEIVMSAANANNASAGGQTYLLMGHDQRLKGDYNAALKSYQKALANAGDNAAEIYQQIAYCYQRKGDKASARTNYETAINEYQKLIAAGRMVERANDGIRTCKNGIKVCE